MKRILLLLTISCFICGSLWATEIKKIGQIQGKKVLLNEIENKEINDLRKKLYESLHLRFQQIALESLWASGKLKKPRAKKISDREAKTFYQVNGLASRGNFAEFAPKIRQHLESLSLAQAMQGQYAKAIKKGWVKENLTPPNDFTLALPIGSAYLWGNRKARVMLLEFSDYQCPFCGRVQDSIKRLRKTYDKKVLFGYRHFPLEFHTDADEAAIAAECARDQGKFPAYHSLLFQNQTALKTKDLKLYAKRIGIKKLKTFSSCLKGEKYRSRVNADLDQGRQLGISGTPSFVIGRYDPKSKRLTGEVMSGAMPYGQLKAVIEKHLHAK